MRLGPTIMRVNALPSRGVAREQPFRLRRGGNSLSSGHPGPVGARRGRLCGAVGGHRYE